MKKSIFKKLGGLFLGLAMGLGVAVGVAAGNKASGVKALDGYTTLTPAADFTTKSVGSSAYNGTTTYGSWKIVNGANNNKGWTYFKMGGKSTTLSSANPCYIYSTVASNDSIDRIDVNIVAGSLSKSGMSVNSWGVYIYSDDKMTTQIDYVAGGTISNSAKLFTFTPSAGKTWAKGSYVKVSWDLKNTTTQNGIICVDKITLYKEEAAALPLSISGDSTVYNDKTITLSASSNGTAVTGVTWSSSNTGLATVDNNGNVTGVNGTVAGDNVTITAKKDGYEDATKTITVKADTKTLQSISASDAQSTFTLGDSFATTGLKVTGIYSHTNGDPNSEEQITTGITTSPAAGTKLNTVGPQTVTVNAGGKSTTYSINVNYAAVESVKLDYEEGTLGKGGEATLPGVTIEPANANQEYSWGDPDATEGIVYTYDPSTHELAIDANNTIEGTIQFTATATGDSSKTATVTYTVQAAQIAKITGITASATGAIVAKQYVGDAFNSQGFSFAPTWSEGDHDVVEITANDISWNALVAGSNPTGTYSCADGEFTVTITGVTVVNDTLVSIAFAEGCDMTKKSYNVGDLWDFSGLSIVGTMDSGKTAPAIASSNVTFSSDDAVATTTTSITVTASYQGLTTATAKTVTDIEVKEVTMTSLTVNYTGGQPVLGTDFAFAGSITANMSNGTHPTVNLSDVAIGSVDKFTLDQQTITVTHKTTGATGTFNVTYKTKTITYTDSFKSSSIKQGRLMIATKDDSNNWYYLPTDASGGADNPPVKATLQMSNNLPIAPTNNSKDYMWNFTGSGDTYTITNDDGKYLYTTAANNGVRVHTTSTVTWTYNSTNKTLVSSGGRYLGVYTAGNDWRSYTSNHANYSGTGGNIVFYEIISTPSGTADIIKLNAALKSGKTFNEGATISASDFDCSTLDNLNQTKTVTATSVSPTNLVAGENTITVYYNTWSTTVVVNAAEVAHLDHIEVVAGTGTRSFVREGSFDYTGLEVMAYYSNTDKETFPDHKVTGFTVDPSAVDMTTAGTYNVSVSYTENGVTKSTTYSVTVTPKTSTAVTIAGNGIEGSNGVYTLASGVTNEVALTLGCDGDETVEFVQGEQSVVTFVNGSLIVNSSTKTSEQITVSFTAGTATATLTVTISAAEGIQLLSDEEIIGYVGSSFSYDINIKLDNVESATWDLPEGDFVIESETEDNTGFVGTIYFTDEVSDTLTFSALTGKGETLSVDIEVLAVNDDIKSISASLKSGVTYSAGKGQTFSNDDLTVTFERDSGARGTLASNEFTVSGLPEGSFNRVASYQLTITSVENTEATDSVTISVGMPAGENLVTSSTSYTPGTPTTSWSKLTAANQLDANEKVYIYNSTSGYITGDNGSKDATVSKTASDRIEFVIKDLDTTSNTFKLFNSSTQKYITYYSGNQFAIGTTETNKADAAIFKVNKDGNFQCFKGTSKDKFLCTNGNYLRMYDAVGNYTPFDLYISKTTPGQGTYNTTYSNNAMTATIYNFIAKANEVYASVCGSEGNNQKPDLTIWRSVLESAEYNALLADTNSYNLLKSAICGEGAYGPDGVYVASGEKQSSDMVIEFLQKYDRVVSNYPSENYNYLGRDVASSGSRINPILALNEVDNSVWVISAVALVGLTAIGGYFFYRKRKEI